MSHAGLRRKSSDHSALSVPIFGPRYAPSMTVLITKLFITAIWNGSNAKTSLSRSNKYKKTNKTSLT